jgi:hypothetical protein
MARAEAFSNKQSEARKVFIITCRETQKYNFVAEKYPKLLPRNVKNRFRGRKITSISCHKTGKLQKVAVKNAGYNFLH